MRYDLADVGAGPAGAATALGALLDHPSVSVALIDRALLAGHLCHTDLAARLAALAQCSMRTAGSCCGPGVLDDPVELGLPGGRISRPLAAHGSAWRTD